MPRIPTTRVFEKIWEAANKKDTEVVVLQGSSRSSKTYSIVQYLIGQCLTRPGITVRAFREDSTTTQPTIVADFREIMKNHFQKWERNRFNRTEKHYTFENDSVFYFDGTNDLEQLHGQQQDIAWLNEVMEIPFDAWNQIEIRTREICFMDYNPSVTSHWVFDTVLTRDKGVEYIHSTYQDNDFLTDKQVSRIESLEPTEENLRSGTANEWKWRVYGKGERAGREGRIFENYRIDENWPDIYACEKHGYGLDFGYTDPVALIECALFQSEIWFREMIYERGLIVTPHESRPNTPSIHRYMEQLGVSTSKKIYADSSRPDQIEALRQMGWNIVGVRKGPDSLLNGIQLLQNYTIVVQRQSQHILEELENYVWQKHSKTGSPLDQPIDEYNHGLDAGRYWGMEELMPAKRRGPIDVSQLPVEAEAGSVL